LTIELAEIHKDNLRDFLRLKVAPEQERFVAPNAVSVAQAYFYRDTAWFRGICDAREALVARGPVDAELRLSRDALTRRREGFTPPDIA
jgi:hypothetical protein